MAILYSNCQGCGEYDITGYVSCKEKQLCPYCASVFIPNTNPFDLRSLYERQFNRMNKPHPFPHITILLGERNGISYVVISGKTNHALQRVNKNGEFEPTDVHYCVNNIPLSGRGF